MTIEIHTLCVLKDNYCYLLRDVSSGFVAVVDPGEASPIVAALDKRDWQLDAVLCTHHHHDHVGGNAELKLLYDCEIVCSTYDLKRVPKATIGLDDGESFSLGLTQVTAIAIPGHTLGHTAFYIKESDAVFCGDTLFAFGAGRLFEGDAAQLRSSLAKLAALPAQTQAYYGHEYAENNAHFAENLGNAEPALAKRAAEIRTRLRAGLMATPGLIGEELATNPFFRVEDPIWRVRYGFNEHDAASAFAELRRQRDAF